MPRGDARLWAGALAISLLLPAGAVAAETYVGRVTREGQPPLPLTLVIQQYTSDDRVLALAQLLHDRGATVAGQELAKDAVGSLRLGGDAFTVSVARFLDTAEGRYIRAVVSQPLALGAPAPAGGEAVGFIELKLDAQGKGGGRLLTAARIVFDAEGFLEPESVGPAPLAVVDVSASK
jgi:hypothetical protein